MAEYRDWLSNGNADSGPLDARPNRHLRDYLRFYIEAHSTSVGSYVWEQLVFSLFSWIPGLPGIASRALAYKSLLHCKSWVAIEPGVRICQPRNVTLGNGVYLDHGVYLHACPQGIRIGDNSYIMHHAELHVYNFRGMQHSRIRLGRNCIVGEFSVIRGQGGVAIGDSVIIGPRVQIMAVDHVFDDPGRPILEQGIQALGIEIEDGAWIGAGAIILDGVRIGRGAVVGAGAVVTHDVARHTVVAGVPARLLRRIRRSRPATRESRVRREAVTER
jgi:acetyltransferase-like isoleucine patch superfamily enzyme